MTSGIPTRFAEVAGIAPLVISLPRTNSPGTRGWNRRTITLERQPTSREEAIAWTKWLLGQDITVNIGLLQVNSEHTAPLHRTPEQVFDPCTNVVPALLFVPLSLRMDVESDPTRSNAKPCSQPRTGVGFLLIPPPRTPRLIPEQIESEVHVMPVNKEFTIRLEDRPGTLGKVCQALADQNINILAFQQLPLEKGKGAVRLVLDNPAAAKTTLDGQRADYTETEVAQIKLSHRPGELARAASRLGEAGININYGYCGTEPGSNAMFVIFGVAEVGKAVKIFEQAAAARPTT